MCAGRGLDTLAARLAELRRLLDGDLEDVERELAKVGLDGDTPAHKSARHLLGLSG